MHWAHNRFESSRTAGVVLSHLKKCALCIFVLSFALPGVGLALDAQCPSRLLTLHYYKNTDKELGCFEQWQFKLFARVGCPIQFSENGYASQTRRLQLLEHGSIDFLIGLSKTPERQTVFNFSEPFGANRLRLFARADAPRWLKINAFCDPVMKQARVIIPAAGYFGPISDAFREAPGQQCAAAIDTYQKGSDQAAQMLLRGRADLMLSGEEWLALSDKSVRSALTALPAFVWRDHVRIAFNRAYTSTFLHRVNAAIAKDIAENGVPCGLQAID